MLIQGQENIDILIGKKGKSVPHVHLGINLDQSLRFSEPRKVLTSIRREIDSEKYGKLKDETINYNSKEGKAKLRFKVDIDNKTKLIDIRFFEVILDEYTKL